MLITMRQLKTCVAVVVVSYGTVYMFSGLPYCLLYALFLYLLVSFLRIPPPQSRQAEAIVGEDLWVENENGDDSCFYLRTVAHRGAGLDAPENSLEAFRLCAEKKCQCIEFDVVLTADNVPIVFHDGTLERMTNSEKRISKHFWNEISSYDISIKHPLKERFHATSIPTLDQTITQLLENNQRMFIDLKSYNTKMVGVILNLFERYPDLYTNAVVSSFFPNLIYLIRRKNPKIVCSLAWRPGIFAYKSYSSKIGLGTRRERNIFKHTLLCVLDAIHEWFLPRITYYLLGISMILLHKDVISADTVLKWREKGIRVIAWTVNAPAEKAHFTKILKITYMTDTLVGEATIHNSKTQTS